MDFADKLDSKIKLDYIYRQHYIEEDGRCKYFISNNRLDPLCRNYDCHDYGKCCLSENMIDEGGYDKYDR